MLTYTTDDGLSLSVDHDRFDCENYRTGHGRMSYRWTVDIGGTVATGDDLRSGTTVPESAPSLAEMLATLCSFLSAAAEGGESADMFGAEIADALAAVGSDRFALIGEDVWADR